MAADEKTVGFRSDADTVDQIDQYKEARGFENRSDALQELTRIGLRESSSPLLSRAKDKGLELSYQLGLGAIVVMVLGATTEVLSPWHAVQTASIFLLVSAFVLTMVELARTMNAQNTLGDDIREKIA